MTQPLLQRLRSTIAHVRGAPLLSRAFTGSFFTIAGGGANQLLRLAANLALSRLLFPDAFGLMTLVTTFTQGLRMLSDIGIGPSVIQNPRGEEEGFLRTAWSLQVVRGIAIGLVSVLIAWPLAEYYEDASLVRFVPAVGLQAVIAGFNSTTLFLLHRRLLLGKRVLLDLASQLFGIVVMVGWALLAQTPWALVAGGLAETLFLMVVSHWIEPRSEHRFAIDRDEAKAMLRFGRWVFVATGFTFLATKVGPLMLGKAFPEKTTLGIYGVAVAWSAPLVETVRDLASRVLFPLFARWSDDNRGELRRRILRTRLLMAVLTTVPLLLLTLFGPWLLELLYKPNWWSAGPMLRLLAAGSIGACSVATLEPALLALGDSFRHMLWQGGRFAITFGCALYGLHVGGADGFVVGMAWSNLAVVPLLLALINSHGLLTPLLDFVLVGISATALLLLR